MNGKDCLECKNNVEHHSIPKGFCVLETGIYRNGELFLFEEHVDRMLNAASYFQKYWAHTPEKPFENIPSKDELKKAMLDVLHSQVGQFKPTDVIATRIMMDTKCQLSAELSVFHDVTKAGGNKKVVIDKEPINTNSPFVKNKTTHRDIYNMSRERNGVSFDGPIFDAILHNEDGEITESTIANVAIKVKQDQDDGYVLVTPIKDSGLIGGTMRRRLLENKAGKWGKMIEGKITVDQLKEFIGVEGEENVFCFNSAREIYCVDVVSAE